MSVKLGSINCNGFKSFEPLAQNLLDKCDILCIQELMLTKQECVLLNSFNGDCYGYGVSPVDASSGIIRGRPFGGVGFIWKKQLDANIEIIECEFDWLCCIKISDSTKEYYLLNVYLPYECEDNRDRFNDCLAKLSVFADNITSTYVTIVGDFNANISRQSVFGNALQKFCSDNNFIMADKETLPDDTYTYVSSAWGTTSWLDHVLCSLDAKQCTGNFEVCYDYILSDHHPIIGTIEVNIGTVHTADCNRTIANRRVAWGKLSPDVLRRYTENTEAGLASMRIPNGVKCTDPNCQNASHADEIDVFYGDICKVLSKASADLSSSSCGGTDHNRNVVGWNEQVKELHEAAREAYLLWRQTGKARQGIVYDLMRQSRSKFKYALRLCKNSKNKTVADKIAEQLYDKNDKDFWKEIKIAANCKIKLPNVVGNAIGTEEISVMWYDYYKSIFNVVQDSSSGALHVDLCRDQYTFEGNMIVHPCEIDEIIKCLPGNKSPGLDGLTSEHMQYASSQIAIYFSMLLTAMMIHGYVPKSMRNAVIVPIIKNKNKRSTDKDNYRPICLSNVFSKVVEKVLYSRMQNWLLTTPNQFGFKPKHGTEMCVFVLKELIRYYVDHGSCMYVAFLDASKAFDRVNHVKLFNKLLKLGVPKWIVRLICQWYSNQTLCVRWGSTISNSFFVHNGVRQGGLLSPLLFNTYMNDLSVQLSKLPVGCCSGDMVINHLMYADDIVLVAPSAKGMQRLIDVAYNYGCQYDIIFNSSKSQMMVFDTRKIGHTVDFSIGSSTMNETTSYRYLGHIITNNLSDEADIEEKVRSLYVRCNSLLRKFYFCSDKVKNKLFSCYCSNVYLCSLWVKFRKSVLKRFTVAYNNAFRIMHGLSMRCSASFMFANARVDSCQARTRKCIHSIMCRIGVSTNCIVKRIATSDVHTLSQLHSVWYSALYSTAMGQ